MNIFKKILGIAKSLLDKALVLAKDSGLSDEVVDLALRWVRVAAVQFVDNVERREFVVKTLVDRGIPESISRLAVELAYRLYKKEIAPKIGA